MPFVAISQKCCGSKWLGGKRVRENLLLVIAKSHTQTENSPSSTYLRTDWTPDELLPLRDL